MTELSPETSSETLTQLQSFCRGEMSAVESYTLALHSPKLVPFAATLRACRESHRKRVHTLTRAIANLEGKIPQTSRAWGALSGAIEGTATAVGASQAISVLQEGEEHRLEDYLAHLQDLTTDARLRVERQVLPAQRETTSWITHLKYSLQ